MVVDRFRKRLSNWKVKLLSFGGRFTLTKSILGSLGIYFFSLFRLPATVCHALESCRAKFFWGMEEGQGRIHWVKWHVVFNTRDKSGLDIGSLDAFNHALLYKWKWQFVTTQNFPSCSV